jgi:hypothetical protein
MNLRVGKSDAHENSQTRQRRVAKSSRYSSGAMTTLERPYIETVGKFVLCRRELDKADLCFIGEFTRENISRWLDKGYWFEMGIYGYEDFHAVCGDIDIPWATEEARLCYAAVGRTGAVVNTVRSSE